MRHNYLEDAVELAVIDWLGEIGEVVS